MGLVVFIKKYGDINAYLKHLVKIFIKTSALEYEISRELSKLNCAGNGDTEIQWLQLSRLEQDYGKRRI